MIKKYVAIISALQVAIVWILPSILGMSISESEEIFSAPGPFESYVYKVPESNQSSDKKTSTKVTDVRHYNKTDDSNDWGHDSRPNQQLGPFFGFFNNLFSDQTSSDGSGCTTPSTCPKCSQPAPGYLTECKGTIDAVMSAAPNGTINVTIPSVNQPAEVCAFGLLALAPNSKISVKFTKLPAAPAAVYLFSSTREVIRQGVEYFSSPSATVLVDPLASRNISFIAVWYAF